MKLELSNLQKFCRTCLDCLQSTVETSQTASVKNYDMRETPDLVKMIIICTALNINEDIDMMYPQRICSKCYHTLLEFQRFREMAIKSQKVFHAIVENADGEFIAENVDAEKRFPKKSEDATTKNTEMHFEMSKPKLSDSYCAISEDETESDRDILLNKKREIENVTCENDAYDNQTGNSADFDVDGSAVIADISASSSKIANKRKRIADNDNEELFQSTDSNYEDVYNSNENLHKYLKENEAATEKRTYTTVISPLCPNEIKAKIISGDYRINMKRGRSKVWNIFGNVITEMGEMIYGIVALRHKCYISQIALEMAGDNVPTLRGLDIEWKRKGVRAFTQWSLENCRPYKIAEDSGFRNIAKYFILIGATYGQNVNIASAFPHPTTISRNVTNIYDIIFEKVKSQINLIKDIGFGLTSDIWTDNYFKTSYIALTMHYIKEGSLFTRLLGLQSMNGERCTHENIQEKVRNMLMVFDCDLNDDAIIVTDRGPNMVEAFRSFQHIFCINHLINNALEKAMDEVSVLVDLCVFCSKLVNYLNKSGINSSLQPTLKSYCRTRWNTTYYLFRSILQNWEEINKILQEKNELYRINNINLTQLQGIITILEPFDESLKKLEEEHYPTIHLTLMHINRLVKKCSPEFIDHTMVKEFKERLSINLESTVLKNLTIYHKMAIFLFPPTNKMVQFDEGDKQLVKDKCKLMMRTYQIEIPVQRHGDEVIQLSASNQELVADYIQSTGYSNEDLAIDNELLMYEKNNVAFHDDFDVLHWWYHNKTEFPLLFKVSCKILATPASSAPSKRIFSLARNIISEDINANIDYIDQIMFANVNIGKDILCEINSSCII